MDDLISRQGMCDSLNKYRIEKMKEGTDVSLVWDCIDKVLQEPSAQPLIDAICPHYIRNEHDRGDDSLCRKFQCEVSALPRKTGKWDEKEVIEDGNIIEEWQSARCSVCGKYHTTPYMYYFDNYKFCPNCGAKMEGEDDE